MLKKYFLFFLLLIPITLLTPQPVKAIGGGNFAGGDLTLGAGDILWGGTEYTNIRNFNVPKGITVQVKGKVVIRASNINVQGTLDGTGFGNPGGGGGTGGKTNPCFNQDCPDINFGGTNGGGGTGPGAGSGGQGSTDPWMDRSEEDGGCGCFLGAYLWGGGGPGGGGGSYGYSGGKGGAGANNGSAKHPNYPGNPGSAFGTLNKEDCEVGSGGGGGAGGQGGDETVGGNGATGGTGGAAISLYAAQSATVSGTILVNGTAGGTGNQGGNGWGGNFRGGSGGGGGGGGSGGCILIVASQDLNLGGSTLQARGGTGGTGGEAQSRLWGCADSAGGGGGGGAGRIKLSNNISSNGSYTISGGSGGPGGYHSASIDSEGGMCVSSGYPGAAGSPTSATPGFITPPYITIDKLYVPTVLPCTNANTYTLPITWTTSGITWVDLSSDENFTNYTHRYVVGTSSINAPFGFGPYQGSGPTQLFSGSTNTYFIRLFNGTNHSRITSFTRPKCS